MAFQLTSNYGKGFDDASDIFMLSDAAGVEKDGGVDLIALQDLATLLLRGGVIKEARSGCPVDLTNATGRNVEELFDVAAGGGRNCNTRAAWSRPWRK
ncbi:MAG: hypothetical protein WKF37_05955 [Bryobacteraceae bacterium]